MTNLSNIVEVLAQQALGGNQQASGQGGLGGILGSVLGQMGGNSSSGAQGGLGGVLGSVLGQVTGNNNNAPQAGGGVQSLLIAVVPLILGWVQQQGGLQAALEKLKGAGLGNQVQSWVDPNQSNSEVPT
ncbi:MAG: YidB family protein, partial [Acinetobacter calcoaceticus]